MSYLDDLAEQGPLAPHLVRLLLLDLPTLDRARLDREVQARCGKVECMGGEPGPVMYAHPQHLSRFKGGSVPCQHAILPGEPGRGPSLETALQQTWDWREGAHEAAATARNTLLITDLLGAGLDRGPRLRLLHGVVSAVLDQVSAIAIHWLPSDRLVDPAAYRELSDDTARLLGASINVRLFRIEGVAGDETVMDTIGLIAFGLPDVQLHFTRQDPSSVAPWLFNLAAYLFEKGDVILDGHTVEGLEPGQRWPCRHEWALAGPKRVVLDVHPGARR